MPLHEIAPIRESRSNYDELEAKLKRFFKQHIYYPLLADLSISRTMIKNDRVTSLMDALFTGRVTFNRGVFSGMFNSYISQDLRDIGAKFDRKSGTYRLTADKLPMEIKNVISASSLKFQEKIDKVDKRLADIVPEELADKFESAKIFDRTLWDVDKKFKKNVEHITVAPQLTDDQRKKIADEWSNNMKLWIKDFTQKEIISLRAKVQQNVFTGNRYGELIKTIQSSYGVSARKAKFLARQETALLMAKHKQVKYQAAGINEYKWRAVTGTPLHPVRPMHKELDRQSRAGKIFRYDDPPVDDPDGSKHNPGENFNCRCTSVGIIRTP